MPKIIKIVLIGIITALKRGGDGMRLTERERTISDRVITQYLRKNFNGEAGILMDHIDVSAPGGFVDVEAAIIADNKKTGIQITVMG